MPRHKYLRLLALMLVATAPALAFPQEVHAAAAVETASGFDLAKITNALSCEQLAVDDPNFSQLVSAMAASEDLADVETAYPGLTRYMVISMLPWLNLGIEESIPQLWTDIGVVFDAELTADERSSLHRLFESSGGQKLLSAMCANAQLDGIIDDVMSDDMMIKTSTVQKSWEDTKSVAVKQAVDAMSEAELAEFERLVPKAGFQKFTAIRPKIVEIKTAWMNEDNPKYDNQLDAAIDSAIEEYIAATDEGRTPKKLPAEK